MSRHIALVLEYDGSAFLGWQEQPGLRTIQAELRRALEMATRSKVMRLCASGRTDSGVHARGQVVSFWTDSQCDLRDLAYSVSSILRGEVAVLHVAQMPEEFHPRNSALRKRYEYTILYRNSPPALDRGRVWHLRGPLDLALMSKEALSLVGRHDFKTFQGSGCSAKTTIREIFRSELVWHQPYLRYVVEGEGFLKQMVRNIVGTLVDRGRGRLDYSVNELIAERDRRRAGITAPAQGLTLQWVRYEERFMDLLKSPSWEQ